MDTPRRRLPVSKRRLVAQAYGHVCYYCGRPGAEVDHVTPVAAGGDDGLENLVWACRRCNRRKGARSWWQWVEDESTGLAGG